MTEIMILYIGLIVYLLVMGFAVVFKIKWLFMIGGFLWLIPVFQGIDEFITLVSVVMFIVHMILGFYEPKESEF